MGSVYEARDEHTYRLVAVKLFATPDSMTTADRVRQEREIRLLSMLSHPGLVPLYDAGTHEFEDGPHRFIVMELIADTTLLRRLAAVRCTTTRSPTSARSSPTPWRTCTRAASCTATSSRRTS